MDKASQIKVREMSEFYPRWQQDQIIEALEAMRVLMLVGSRQCGKTTLVKTLKNSSYQTLDDSLVLDAALSDLGGFVKHDDGLMIIDEIQRAPDLLRAIKIDVDENQKRGRFLVTGSSNVHALKGVESLAGRASKIRLRPLAMGEIAGNPPRFLERAFAGEFKTAHPTQTQPDDKKSYITYAMQGGYPEARAYKQASRKKTWHENYLNRILDRDMKDVANIAKQDSMVKLVEVLATWSSKYMDIATICRELSVSRQTIDAYIDALEALYLVDRVYAWSTSNYQRTNRKSKLFMTDTGFMFAVLNWNFDKVVFDGNLNGKLLKTFIYNQLSAIADAEQENYKIYHYRDREKREIDFIVENSDGDILGIEVKAGTNVADAFKHLKWFKKNLVKEQGFTGIVLYTGEQVLSFGDNMWAVPINCMWS